MHVHMLQETSRPTLHRNYKKNAAAQIGPRTQVITLCEPAQSKCMSTYQKEYQKSNFHRNYKNNAAAQIRPKTQTNTLCEPAQSKCMSTCHRRHQKSDFTQNFGGKMPRPRVGPEDRRTRGASLRNRNACPHVTRNIRRATLYGNLRKNAAAQIGPRMQRTLCASLCNRNACQDFTRATLCGNLQAKCRRPEWAP